MGGLSLCRRLFQSLSQSVDVPRVSARARLCAGVCVRQRVSGGLSGFCRISLSPATFLCHEHHRCLF